MKGGLNNPPNGLGSVLAEMGLPASMKGGLNNPPNQLAALDPIDEQLASMKGGLNNPPNTGGLNLQNSGTDLLQ